MRIHLKSCLTSCFIPIINTIVNCKLFGQAKLSWAKLTKNSPCLKHPLKIFYERCCHCQYFTKLVIKCVLDTRDPTSMLKFCSLQLSRMPGLLSSLPGPIPNIPLSIQCSILIYVTKFGSSLFWPSTPLQFRAPHLIRIQIHRSTDLPSAPSIRLISARMDDLWLIWGGCDISIYK